MSGITRSIHSHTNGGNVALGVKRIIRDDGWLKCLHRDNVELVSSPIIQVTENGLVTADGKEHEFDVIVWATGFEVVSDGECCSMISADTQYFRLLKGVDSTRTSMA